MSSNPLIGQWQCIHCLAYHCRAGDICYECDVDGAEEKDLIDQLQDMIISIDQTPSLDGLLESFDNLIIELEKKPKLGAPRPAPKPRDRRKNPLTER